MNNFKKTLQLHLKNTIGWRTKRKIVVFAIDDYGNVRLASTKARAALNQAGLKVTNRFDAYDTLETAEDLSALFDTLCSVKDQQGRSAVFTPLALPANIDFERVIASNYQDYFYELLPETLEKSPHHQGVFKLWQQGISQGIFLPQFHGREHLNLKVFRHLLNNKDRELLANLRERSYASISAKPYTDITYTAAFKFQDFQENENLKEVALDGLNLFEQVFGYRATLFNAPGGNEHHDLHEALAQGGIQYIETKLIKKEHQGDSRYRRTFNYTGKGNEYGQTMLVRNCVFEPTEKRGLDWVDFCLLQIATAFKWNRPALISSHRVNFCGHIDEQNRKKGLDALKQVLQKVVTRWPEVEFMAAHEVGDLITKN